MENPTKPEIKAVVSEVIRQYDIYNGTKSKIRRSEEGKKLDKSIKKLKRYLEKDESQNYI
jgi:hypothetical protein